MKLFGSSKRSKNEAWILALLLIVGFNVYATTARDRTAPHVSPVTLTGNTRQLILTSNNTTRNKWCVSTTSGAPAWYMELGTTMTASTRTTFQPMGSGQTYCDMGNGALVYSGKISGMMKNTSETAVIYILTH